MQLIVTPLNKNHAEKLFKMGVNVFHIGMPNFSLKSQATFTIEDVQSLAQTIPNSERWILINKLIHHEDLKLVSDLLKQISPAITGIVVADFGLMKMIKENFPTLKMQYDPEHLITNSYALEFATNAGANQIGMSREINLAQIKLMNVDKKYQTCAIVQGSYQILYSKRNLLTNYFEDQNMKLSAQENYKIFDEERSVFYQINEDENGTVILGAEDICMVDELEELEEANIEYLKIEGFLKSEQYINDVAHEYLLALALYDADIEAYFNLAKKIKQNIANLDENLTLGKGFYYKSSTYITKSE